MEIPLPGSIFQSRHWFWNYIPLLEATTFPMLPIYQKIWRFPFTFNLTLNKSLLTAPESMQSYSKNDKNAS